MRSLQTRRIIPERPRGHDAFLRRAMAWVVVAICAVLVVATIGEALARADVEQQVATARQRNQSLQSDAQTLQRAIEVAGSDEEIERQARSWGWTRPGDQPILIIPPATR